MPQVRRLSLRRDAGLYDLIELDDIYYARAAGGDTELRTRRRRAYLTSEPLGDLEQRLPRPPFCRIHRSVIVNLDRVRQLRRRPGGDWELKLDPPVNVVLPVSRRRERRLFTLIGRPDR